MARTAMLLSAVLLVWLWAIAPATGLSAAAPTLRIFYSDLDSGPNKGGENDQGVYVTIYGQGFGLTQGPSKVTVGGGAAAAYPIWNDTKITFQLGPSPRTGDIVVHTAARSSNGVGFTVRSGNIYFVSLAGNDRNRGTFAGPWRTIQHAIQAIAAGDTIYAMDGVAETRPGSSDGSVEIASSGVPGQPKALVAYPRAKVTIGSEGTGICASTSCVEGLYTFNINRSYNDWTVAGLRLRGNNTAFLVTGGPRPDHLSTNWRVVGNDFSCPHIHSLSGPACVTFSQAQNIKFYGNNIHDVGQPGDAVQEYGHGLYFSTDVIHIDAGWNTVASVKGCRCVQVHSSPLGRGDASDPTGYNQYDIAIHDNLIHDCACDGLLFWSIDPSQGHVTAYNNVIYNAGAGPRPSSGSGFFSCIYVAAVTNNSGAPRPSGTTDISNNTLYNCGAAKATAVSAWPGVAVQSGAGSSANPHVSLRLRNNIIQMLPGHIYTASESAPLIGSNNLWFGAGFPPSNGGYIDLSSNLSSDPLFVNPSQADFHLQAGSAARNAGVNAGVPADKDGLPRSGSEASDMGAYQFAVTPVAEFRVGRPITRHGKQRCCSDSRAVRRTTGDGHRDRPAFDIHATKFTVVAGR